LKTDKSKILIEQLLSLAGVEINGNKPQDIRINNSQFYSRIISQQSLGLGESYMDGWWDCEKLDEFFHHILRAKIDSKIKNNRELLFRIFVAKFFNLQSANRAFQIGERHYDLGNDLFENMLDKRMVYSCGYWKDSKTLDQAQEDKLELVCRKLRLRPGMKVLDIGCGWGSLARYAAEKHKVSVTGITVSKEQVEVGRKVCDGLPVEIRLQDYRDVVDEFDCIVSLGMIEHVGYKNYRTYMEVVNRCLKDDGLFLLHTIGGNKSAKTTDPWLNKYIFPNSMLPSIRQIGKSTEGLFVMEDWHNFSADYDKTLIAWYKNFENNWDKIKSNYDERFFRLWKYYLLSCAGAFRARKNQLWQIVLSKAGIPGGYQSVR
jgi:cyclopropane-fatty-acyl-phospholipid synthase